MPRSTIIVTGLFLFLTASVTAAESNTTLPDQYRLDPVQWPDADLSGEVGQRMLKLLSIQVAKVLHWMEAERDASGISDDEFTLRCIGESRLLRGYDLCQSSNGIFAMAILARCGKPGITMAGTTRDNLERSAVMLLKALLDTHPAGGNPNLKDNLWDKMWGMRMQFEFGTGAWLIWDLLDTQTQLRVAKVLERDADLYLGKPAPAKLHNDTQAESNAWNGAGMAAVACMFRHHPHAKAWDDKAKELMLSAYATQKDVDSSRIVDGKPLNQWLTGPNALSDYTVENHGFIHPDYMAAASEMVRSAIAYRLAGKPVPEASTFNIDKTFDTLMWMTLPGGHYLYAQGTDYCPKRIDSFFQACNVIPLKPDPLRNAYFLRSLAGIEKMAAERPDFPMSGWLGTPYEFGMCWGLTENYMLRRMFGLDGKPLPEDQIEQHLTGVRVFREGMFAIHRTPSTISSFSWHTTSGKSPPMGMTMPLDKDAILYPMPLSLIGELHETADTINTPYHERPKVTSHKVHSTDDSLSVLMQLKRCGQKVTQNCAFISLPDGTSVYLEERIADQPVALAKITSGNVVISDDTRWVYQPRPRRYFSQMGELTPSDNTLHKANWLNIDNRLGYIALGDTMLKLRKVAGTIGIWRRHGTIYNTRRMEYVQYPPSNQPGTAPAHFDTGQRIGTAALIALPNTKAGETKSLASNVHEAGWVVNKAGCLAVQIKTYLVYANSSATAQRIPAAGGQELPPATCGWMKIDAAGSAQQ